MQLPEDKMQDCVLNTPPKLLSLHNIMPVGTIGKLEVSVSKTVSCTLDPEGMLLALDVIARVTSEATFDVIVDVPVLPECVLSPP
jgi:hypothetical protein